MGFKVSLVQYEYELEGQEIVGRGFERASEVLFPSCISSA